MKQHDPKAELAGNMRHFCKVKPQNSCTLSIQLLSSLFILQHCATALWANGLFEL